MHTPGTNKELDAGPCLHLDSLCWVGREARPLVPSCPGEGFWASPHGEPTLHGLRSLSGRPAPPLELTLICFFFEV